MNLSNEDIEPIGGYFEFEISNLGLPYEQALRFQSARAAFLALLRAGRPRRFFAKTYM